MLDITLENTEVGQDALSCDEAQLSDAGEDTYEVTGAQLQTRQSFTAALQTGGCAYSPHTLHCLEVMPGTVAVIVCEKPRKKFAAPLTDLYDLLSSVLVASWAQMGIKTGKHMQDTLESRVKKVATLARKLKNPGHIERLTKEIQSSWDILKGPELQKYIDVGELGSMPPRMETMTSNLLTKVKDLYRLLYLTSRRLTQDDENIQKVLEQLQARFSQQLLDYKDYVAVKAQRNITMTTYHRYFPGLVHFMYVNRKTAQLTAPSINLPLQLEEKTTDLSSVIKQQVWEMVPWLQARLRQGYTSAVVRKGDFVFTYFLWFEDPMGNALQVQHPFRGVDEAILPGLLSADFYSYLVRECFGMPQQKVAQCYELLCVHVGTAPTPYVLRQCRKLATSLWGASGEASSPISLL